MANPSVTSSQLFQALGDWITQVVLDGVSPAPMVVQAFDNAVPPPRAEDPSNPGANYPLGYVVLRTIGSPRLSTDSASYEDGGHNGVDTFVDLAVSREWHAQVDFYGPLSEDWAAIAAGLFRSSPACDFFGTAVDGLAPLYEDDPLQIPLTDGEEQWERRVVLGLRFNYTPVVQVEQDFAATLTPTVIDLT